MSIVYDTVVSSGQSFYVSAPTSAYFTTVYYYGFQFVYGGGFAFETLVSGGIEYVWSGGSDTDSFVYSGGVESVYGGGYTDNALVYSGGQIDIGSGGIASSVAILSGGVGYTSAAGQDSDTTINGGGVQHIYGLSVSAFIAPSGVQTIEASGASYEADILGNQFVDGAFSSTYYASALTSGGEQTVYAGVAYSTILSDGGTQYVDGEYGGVGSETFVYSGGVQSIVSGGEAYGTQVASGGVVYNDGGVDSSIYLAPGAAQYVYAESDGYSDDAAIASGANQYIEFGGTASATDDGGNQFVYLGGDTEFRFCSERRRCSVRVRRICRRHRPVCWRRPVRL